MFSKLFLVLLAITPVLRATSFDFNTQTSHGFVSVRPNAHMFWWLYYASKLTSGGFVRRMDAANYPVVIWLQGGPGGSSTAFGNFELIGPMDKDFQLRNSSWIQHANVLFIDNPVGTGFSYVTNPNAFTTDNMMIAQDLVTTLRQFLAQNTEFQNSPLYIFSESYGGKMAVDFAIRLYEEIQTGTIACNFQGISLGDSWISPVDSVQTWPQYLKSFSLIDENEFESLTSKINELKTLMNKKEYEEATNSWSFIEGLIRRYTFDVDFYNVMRYGEANDLTQKDWEVNLLQIYNEIELEDLMNTKIREILSIPDSVIWGSQARDVFKKLRGDFMKPVVERVAFILDNLPIKVVIYNGQFDLIVNILGTMKWVDNLHYQNSAKFKSTHKVAFPNQEHILGYYKSCGKLTFYWILKAGHMVPADSSDAALYILTHTLKSK